jgi:hypothetical protein
MRHAACGAAQISQEIDGRAHRHTLRPRQPWQKMCAVLGTDRPAGEGEKKDLVARSAAREARPPENVRSSDAVLLDSLSFARSLAAGCHMPAVHGVRFERKTGWESGGLARAPHLLGRASRAGVSATPVAVSQPLQPFPLVGGCAAQPATHCNNCMHCAPWQVGTGAWCLPSGNRHTPADRQAARSQPPWHSVVWPPSAACSLAECMTDSWQLAACWLCCFSFIHLFSMNVCVYVHMCVCWALRLLSALSRGWLVAGWLAASKQATSEQARSHSPTTHSLIH